MAYKVYCQHKDAPPCEVWEYRSEIDAEVARRELSRVGFYSWVVSTTTDHQQKESEVQSEN